MCDKWNASWQWHYNYIVPYESCDGAIFEQNKKIYVASGEYNK